MAITREELKVGGKYLLENDSNSNSLVVVTAIGEYSVLYKYNEHGEFSISIQTFLETRSLTPKPKKQIKLVGYITEDGVFEELLDIRTVSKTWKMISRRAIEIEE